MCSNYAIGGALGPGLAGEFYGEECEDNALNKLPPDLSKLARSVAGIAWINKDFSFQLGLAGLGWGNEVCLEESCLRPCLRKKKQCQEKNSRKEKKKKKKPFLIFQEIPSDLIISGMSAWSIALPLLQHSGMERQTCCCVHDVTRRAPTASA